MTGFGVRGVRGVCAGLVLLGTVRAAEADLLVSSWTNYTVNRYGTTGAAVNVPLVTGLSAPAGIAVSGTDLYVVNAGNGKVGKYTIGGATQNASLLSGLPLGDSLYLAVSGTNLYVLNYYSGTIGRYTTAGATVNAALIGGLVTPLGFAASDTALFVSNAAQGKVAKYTTAGVLVDASFLSGLGAYGPEGLAVSGDDLYVVNTDKGTVGKYSTAGATVDANLITGLTNPTLVTVSGSDLFVYANGTGKQYLTDGTLVNAAYRTGLGTSYGIAAIGVPEPGSLLILVGGVGLVWCRRKVI